MLEILSSASEPLDVNAIWKSLRSKKVVVNQATVYRILDVFVDKDIAVSVDLREGKLRYELNSEHHHHLTCKSCGSISPIYDLCLQIDESEIRNKYGFLVSEHSLEFFGECHSCQK